MYTECIIVVPPECQGHPTQYGMQVNLHGHVGKYLTRLRGGKMGLFWSDKESKYQYHFVKNDWIVDLPTK